MTRKCDTCWFVAAALVLRRGRQDEQTAGGAVYFDAAGAPGRTFGLRP